MLSELKHVTETPNQVVLGLAGLEAVWTASAAFRTIHKVLLRPCSGTVSVSPSWEPCHTSIQNLNCFSWILVCDGAVEERICLSEGGRNLCDRKEGQLMNLTPPHPHNPRTEIDRDG